MRNCETFETIESDLNSVHLGVLGGVHLEPSDPFFKKWRTILLLGAHSPAFWPYFKTTPEYMDADAHPMDRWSKRIISDFADKFDACAIMPFTPAPYKPFFSWALQSGRFHASPIGMLVHHKFGLMGAFRGALGFRKRLEFPLEKTQSPCSDCKKPCLSSCPVGAFTPTAYDEKSCQAHLRSPEGAECAQKGCLARRACPLSVNLSQSPEHAAFHMGYFQRRTHSKTQST